jgi:hypothetical protein
MYTFVMDVLVRAGSIDTVLNSAERYVNYGNPEQSKTVDRARG